MNIKEQLAKIALKKVKFADGQTLAEKMASEAKRLYNCIQYYIDEYYNSYEPIVYRRDYYYQGALYAEDIADIRVKGNSLELSLIFRHDLATQPNLEYVSLYNNMTDENEYFYLSPHDSFVPQLMEFGWYAPRLENMIGQSIYRLTYFDGIHAISKGIWDFNKSNKLGIKIILPDALREY